MPTLTEGVAEYAAEGCLIKPIFLAFFQDPSIEFEFDLKVRRPIPREPDGWFHASQHPMASDQELYEWMTGRVAEDTFGYIGLMSVMFGSLGHAVFEAMLDRMGVAVPLPVTNCPACGRPRRQLRARADPRKYCTEHGFIHRATRSRCHLDAIADFGELTGVDFKTIHQFGFKKTSAHPAVPDMDAEAFKARWPEYWAQGQECMRLSGLRKYIFFFLTLGNPWETREFHFEFDPEFAWNTEQRYLKAIERAARG